jgi:hypothetical protein
VLKDSNYTLSFLDYAHVWSDKLNGNTILNVISSNADLICDYPNEVILDVVLKELQRFLDFRLEDVDKERCHIQTNVGEELFVNQVGSWDYRPTATCDIPNLFLAGDFCQTVVDVVTVEGAVVSGLVAAEALRRRRGIGKPIACVEPDSYPAIVPAMLAVALLPAAIAAKAFSVATSMMGGQFFSRMFRNS